MFRSALLALLVAIPATADPPKKPSLGGIPSVLQPVAPAPMPVKPAPLAVLPIDDGKVRVFWVDSYTGTVPVRWKVCQATGTAGLTIIPVGAAEVIVPLQGESTIAKHPIPAGVKGVIAVAGTGKGEVSLVADGVVGDEIVTLLSYRVSVNTAAQPPPVDPPVDPPAKKGTPYLFVVRPDGPAQQSFVKVMSDPAWDEHRKAGIMVRDATLTESQSVISLPSGTTLPCVTALLIAEDGKSFKIVAQPVALPTDSPSLKKLAEAFK